MALAYSNETKAAAVAAVLSGQSVNSVAKQFGVSRAAIIKWRDQAGVTYEVTDVTHQKKHDIGMQVYDLLEESIETLRFQLRATRDEEWIKRQTADALAVHYGVLADKTIRILTAYQPSEESEPYE